MSIPYIMNPSHLLQWRLFYHNNRRFLERNDNYDFLSRRFHCTSHWLFSIRSLSFLHFLLHSIWSFINLVIVPLNWDYSLSYSHVSIGATNFRERKRERKERYYIWGRGKGLKSRRGKEVRRLPIIHSFLSPSQCVSPLFLPFSVQFPSFSRSISYVCVCRGIGIRRYFSYFLPIQIPQNWSNTVRYWLFLHWYCDTVDTADNIFV